MARTEGQRILDIQNGSLRRPTGLVHEPWYPEFLKDPNAFYREFYIPKTELKKKLNSGYRLPYPRNRIPREELSKWRKISAPVDPLKDAQKNIAEALYARAPSPFDYCVRGRNRYQAMQKHANSKIIIAMDIKDAFPSTKIDMIKKTLLDERFDEHDVDYIVNVCTRNGSLPQGSPASPILLNLVRKRLDYRLAGYVKKRYNGRLTVYVDNYFISSNDPQMNKGILAFREIAEQERLKLNNKKIYIMRKGSRQSGLGLVLSHSSITEEEARGNPDAIERRGSYGYRAGHGWGYAPSQFFLPKAQPPKRERDRIRAILHQAEKHLDNGEQTQPGFNLMRVAGLVETCHGSVYYPRFKEQLERIREKLNR